MIRGKTRLVVSYANEMTALIQQGHVVFAQDKEHRHAVMKLVRRESEESRVMHFLFEAQNEVHSRDSANPGNPTICGALACGHASVSTLSCTFGNSIF